MAQPKRLLNDDEIGWHAGNWDTNCRSIAICLDNDYSKSEPTDLVLKSMTNLIKRKYPQIKARNIVGHCEINPKTECPGGSFLKEWKPKLIQLFQP